MTIKVPTWIRRYILLENILRSIDADNIVERQRFLLFRVFTLLAVWTCAGMFTEVYASIPFLLIKTIPVLAAGFALNYFLLKWHGKKRLAYFILVSLVFAEIHLTSYFTGGIQNNAFFFSAATLLCAFMLLGTRAGFLYSVAVISNQFYFYFITENTTWVTNMLADASKSAINLDFLITGSLSLVVISIQLISLEGSKTYVLKKLNHSKKELRDTNNDLKKVIAERKKTAEQLAENLRSLKTSHEELEKKNQELDRFSYLVSHDLKAPLRAISTMTRFIEEDAGTKLPEETHQHLDIMRGRIKRMEKLINDILAYSQVTRSRKEASTFTFESLVQETIDLIMVPANCKIEIIGGTMQVTSDRTRLGQLILNLIVNAIKHNDKAQMQIRVTVGDEGSNLHFTISDNGPGIAPEFHEKIFQIFERLKGKEDPESTGVGLAIVKKNR
jgi:signal transduction histidine kinase